MPSISAAPTTCYPVSVHFSSDNLGEIITSCFGLSNEWKAAIQTHAFFEGDSVVIKSYANPDQDTAYDIEDSLCLRPGRYQFILHYQSIADAFNVKYTVKVNEEIIAQNHLEGCTGSEEEIAFDVPYDSASP